MGPNVLALAPRVALALEGNDETRRRMERAGVDVRVYRGDHICARATAARPASTRPPCARSPGSDRGPPPPDCGLLDGCGQYAA